MVVDPTRTNGSFRDIEEKDHIEALKSGVIGKGIFDFLKENSIKIRRNNNLPEGLEGYYISKLFQKKGGIEYGRCVNVTILAHEGRHAMQDKIIPFNIQSPASARDYVLTQRFLEADARAVDFAVTLQTICSLRVYSRYAENLIDCLTPYQRSLYGGDPRDINDLCFNRKDFLQAVRNVFDQWMIDGLGVSYDRKIADTVSNAASPSLSRVFLSSVGNGKKFFPIFKNAEQDKALPEYLGRVLGELPNYQGNYLLDTNGPSLSDPFYTRICDYRIEKAVSALEHNLG